jgi:uncharacterized protein YlxW (UPF0749 family)
MAPTSHRDRPPSPTVPGRRVDESMTLLTSMMERPLDPGYAAAAERRRAGGLPASSGLRTPTVLAAAFVVGLMLTAGAVALRVPSTEVTRAKADLVAQIESRRTAVEQREQQVRALRAEVDALQARALAQTGSGAQARLAELSLVSGATAVRGEGVRLVVDDAPGAREDQTDERQANIITSTDLQIIVNGLWQAGAEAVAVNGQRLTSRSAIRFAGEAILVNYRPLTRPYTIEAIGDSTTLQTDFTEQTGGAYVKLLTDNFGMRISMDGVDSLTLPAATSLTVREATVPRPGATSRATGTAPSSGTSSPLTSSPPTSSPPPTSSTPTSSETTP